MTEAPPETAKDRRRQWYVFFGLCVGLCALIGCLVLGALVHSDQQTINSKDTEIVSLLKQHSATFAAQKKQTAQTNVFLKDLGLLATYLIESNEAVCAKTGAACPALPTIPKIPNS